MRVKNFSLFFLIFETENLASIAQQLPKTKEFA
jgi:hypothetical protein